MEKWNGKVAVVTGASSGIGAAVAEALVNYGIKVAGLARRTEKLTQLAEKLKNRKGKLHPITTDVTREDSILAAFEWVKSNLGPIHILVNSAGILRNTSLVDGDTQMWKEIFETNIIGLLISTREAIKDMRANHVNGHIVHVGSVFGHLVPQIENMNVYPATKFSIKALTETLRLELKVLDSKIKISCVSPGAVATELVSAGNCEENVKKFKLEAFLTSEDVAEAVVYILSTPPHVQIQDLIMKPLGENY